MDDKEIFDWFKIAAADEGLNPDAVDRKSLTLTQVPEVGWNQARIWAAFTYGPNHVSKAFIIDGAPAKLFPSPLLMDELLDLF